MLSEKCLFDLTDKTIQTISQSVAKLEMHKVDAPAFAAENFHSLAVTTGGDYFLTIVFRAGNCVLRAITEQMKRGEPAEDEEISAYSAEFFNIMCGHIITVINNALHTSARFGIPTPIEGLYTDRFVPPRIVKRLYYESGYGAVAVELFYAYPFLLTHI